MQSECSLTNVLSGAHGFSDWLDLVQENNKHQSLPEYKAILDQAKLGARSAAASSSGSVMDQIKLGMEAAAIEASLLTCLMSRIDKLSKDNKEQFLSCVGIAGVDQKMLTDELSRLEALEMKAAPKAPPPT